MIIYYIYKDDTLHSKTWSVSTFKDKLEKHYDSVTYVKPIESEYARIKADSELYRVYDHNRH